MSVKPRTIDNLGIEAAIRYARDKEVFESTFIEDSRIVSQKLEIPVGRPYVPSEFDQLFSIGKTIAWASFYPPPEYFSYAKPLFSYQLIPSLGGYEKQEADADKLAALEDAIDKQKGSKQDQSDKEKEEEEKERKTISELLRCIEKLDRTLILINSRRNQYQRG